MSVVAERKLPSDQGGVRPEDLAKICDCHVHVFGDEAQYPQSPERTYRPGVASLVQLLELYESIGVARTVLVQPSPYGTDNQCLLDALAVLGERGRGVAVVAADVGPDELMRLHSYGVRGVRINLETGRERDCARAWAMLQSAAKAVSPLGWHVQVYASLGTILELAPRFSELPTRIVLDHFAGLKAEQGPSQPGMSDIQGLLRGGRTYVKLSAPYRISEQHGYGNAAGIAEALIAANESRVLWGTDWPHPGWAAGVGLSRDSVTPFKVEDDEAALSRAFAWAGSYQRAKKLLVDNPAELYEFN